MPTRSKKAKKSSKKPSVKKIPLKKQGKTVTFKATPRTDPFDGPIPPLSEIQRLNKEVLEGSNGFGNPSCSCHKREKYRLPTDGYRLPTREELVQMYGERAPGGGQSTPRTAIGPVVLRGITPIILESLLANLSGISSQSHAATEKVNGSRMNFSSGLGSFPNTGPRSNTEEGTRNPLTELILFVADLADFQYNLNGKLVAAVKEAINKQD